MTILENEIHVSLLGGNANYFEKLGYEIPRYIDKKGRLKVKHGTKILVSIKDLPKGSNVKVTKVCDICGRQIPNQPFSMLLKMRENDVDICKSCSMIRRHQKFPPNDKSLWETHPEVASLLDNHQDGFKFTHGSSKEAAFKCKECGYIVKNKRIILVVRDGFTCPRCSDGISYPEKFMCNILQQLNIEFEIQKVFSWSHNKRYDFYIPDLNSIIETHGEQHYNGGYEYFGGKNLKEEQENDRLKEKLAKENGIDNYIVINCRKSELEFLKNNILNSKLKDIFNLSKMDWAMCHELSCASIVKQACDLWNEGIRNSTSIGEILKVARGTARDYLKRGADLGWCDYNAQVAIDEIKYIRGKSNGRHIVQLDLDGNFINEWKSMSEASEKTGTNKTSISQVCRKERNKAGSFKWMYKEEFEKVNIM